MEDFLGSLFCFYILWGCCRVATPCVYPCLNRRFHIAIRSKLLDHILLYRPIIVEDAKHLMGIDGIISYATLIPSAIYLWIRDGKFLFFNPDGIIISVWFTILFWCELFLFLLDFWIGYFLMWCTKTKAEQSRRNPGIPSEILWNDTESEEVKCRAEKIFHTPDKIIWDMDVQEYYYLQGKILLRLRANGTFISMMPDADSPCVLKAMRTGRFIKS